MFSVVSGVVLFFLLLWVEGSFWSVSSGVSEWFCSQGFASSLSTISFKHWKVCSKFVRAALFPCNHYSSILIKVYCQVSVLWVFV